jgi:hypothetical protein
MRKTGSEFPIDFLLNYQYDLTVGSFWEKGARCMHSQVEVRDLIMLHMRACA